MYLMAKAGGRTKRKDDGPGDVAQPDADTGELRRKLERLERENRSLKEKLKDMRQRERDLGRRLRSLEGKMETRIKREEILMSALGLHSRSKKGQRGAIDQLQDSIMKTDEYLLNLGKRLDSVLSAVKNHREHLIRLNNRVYKQDQRARLEMELEIMSNTLSIMALSGFDINRSLLSDVKKLRDMMEDKDTDLAKLKKRMSSFSRKFDEEMERFDFESIYKKAEHIPGYT